MFERTWKSATSCGLINMCYLCRGNHIRDVSVPTTASDIFNYSYRANVLVGPLCLFYFILFRILYLVQFALSRFRVAHFMCARQPTLLFFGAVCGVLDY